MVSVCALVQLVCCLWGPRNFHHFKISSDFKNSKTKMCFRTTLIFTHPHSSSGLSSLQILFDTFSDPLHLFISISLYSSLLGTLQIWLDTFLDPLHLIFHLFISLFIFIFFQTWFSADLAWYIFGPSSSHFPPLHLTLHIYIFFHLIISSLLTS